MFVNYRPLESISETKAVQKFSERILETTAKLRESDMPLKLKGCQKVQIRGYQHKGPYIEGDKVWYQHQDFNSWLGHAKVLFQRDNKVWIHTNSNVKSLQLRNEDESEVGEQAKLV